MAVAAVAQLMLHDLSGAELCTLALSQLNAIVETLGCRRGSLRRRGSCHRSIRKERQPNIGTVEKLYSRQIDCSGEKYVVPEMAATIYRSRQSAVLAKRHMKLTASSRQDDAAICTTIQARSRYSKLHAGR